MKQVDLFQKPDGDSADWLGSLSNASHWLGLPTYMPEVSQSSATSYFTCRRKFLFRYRFRLRPKQFKPKKALDRGSMVHILLDGHYSGRPEAWGVAKCGELIEERLAEAEADTNEFNPVDIPGLSRRLEQWLALSRAMVKYFQGIYPLDSRYKTLSCEERLSFKIPGIQRPLRGIIDRVFEDQETGDLWLGDPKTYDGSPLLRASTCSYEWQPQIYRVLAQLKYPKKKIVGMVHSIIRPPSISFGQNDRPHEEYIHTFTRGARKGETEIRRRYLSGEPDFDLYLKRVVSWYEDFPPEDPPVLQSWVRFSWARLPKETHNVIKEVGRASAALPILENYPRSPHACISKFGVCSYLPFCVSPRPTWRETFRTQFVQEDPK